MSETRVSIVYDNLLTRLSVLFPNHKRIPNPYKPEENGELFLKNGYGIRLGEGSNLNAVVGCLISISRDFTVLLSKKVHAREADGALKGETEKELMEDVFTLIKDAERDGSLNGAVNHTQYVSDSGVNYIFGEKDNFIYSEVTFNCRYFENIN